MPDPDPTDQLTTHERDLLAFERDWWRSGQPKEQAVRERFAMSPLHYYRALNALIDRGAALAHDPVLVRRLRRLRVSRQVARQTARQTARQAARQGTRQMTHQHQRSPARMAQPEWLR